MKRVQVWAVQSLLPHMTKVVVVFLKKKLTNARILIDSKPCDVIRMDGGMEGGRESGNGGVRVSRHVL